VAVQSDEGNVLLQGMVGRDDGCAALRMKIMLRLRSEPVMDGDDNGCGRRSPPWRRRR
jgi:hypothetical protein